jgi:hypothetical protein
MKLIVTIDTEEDNWSDWAGESSSAASIERIPRLQELFDRFAVRPTYLVTHAVACATVASTILRRIEERGACEIGAHCHPWNTPPVEEPRTAAHTMMCNLDAGLLDRKVESLTSKLESVFGRRPSSFRAGRWGYGPRVARAVRQAGYEVDSSVSPYVDWSEEHGPDYSRVPLRSCFLPGELFGGDPGMEPIEIPATVGFLQPDFETASRVLARITSGSWRRLRLYGLLYRLRLLNRVWLSPENQTVREMVALTHTAAARGLPHVNLTFHSSTLQAGLTPFVRSESDERAFLGRIGSYLEFATTAGLASMTLTEAGRRCGSGNGRIPIDASCR